MLRVMAMDEAAFAAAQQQLAQAEINVRRTQIRSPVNGYVTNLITQQPPTVSTASRTAV